MTVADVFVKWSTATESNPVMIITFDKHYIFSNMSKVPEYVLRAKVLSFHEAAPFPYFGDKPVLVFKIDD